ncbi:unnamed protein product [Caenorhabditis auriculariae]|uniref:Uncharacterized protein n=1 Tax=Caenorhabditis auriculariae TaxID=2777116 RepID=A0A8S1HX73_9PELO|nr:unnamed protein product [Caenorhabditis auriculariae]
MNDCEPPRRRLIGDGKMCATANRVSGSRAYQNTVTAIIDKTDGKGKHGGDVIASITGGCQKDDVAKHPPKANAFVNAEDELPILLPVQSLTRTLLEFVLTVLWFSKQLAFHVDIYEQPRALQSQIYRLRPARFCCLRRRVGTKRSVGDGTETLLLDTINKILDMICTLASMVAPVSYSLIQEKFLTQQMKDMPKTIKSKLTDCAKTRNKSGQRGWTMSGDIKTQTVINGVTSREEGGRALSKCHMKAPMTNDKESREEFPRESCVRRRSPVWVINVPTAVTDRPFFVSFPQAKSTHSVLQDG